MYLFKLIKNIKNEIINNNKLINHKINGIFINSKEVINNSIFIAIDKGHDYIKDSIDKSCKTIIYDREIDINIYNRYKTIINFIKVEDSKKIKNLILNIFYKNITKKIKLIGVTGTNGKTTITTLLYNFFKYQNRKVLLIGSNGIYYNMQKYNTYNTTPDSILTLKIINEAYKKGLDYVIMEVSSHSIKELRVEYFDFDIVIYTNLTHDHLDYHKTFDDYKYTKLLFLLKNGKYIILNKDDDYFNFIYQIINKKIITYSLKKESMYKGKIINQSLDKTIFKINDMLFESKLFTDYNILNLVSIYSCLKILKFKDNIINEFFKYFNYIEGRMNIIRKNNKIYVIDYAHSPDSVLKIISNFKTLNKKIITIIGCGGNRDKEKRPLIGNIVTKYSNYVIFTNDNPRLEEPINIIKDITKDLTLNNYEVILDRYEAIKKGISLNYDILLLLGRGSEKYQNINNKLYLFNDMEKLKELLGD